MLNTVTRDQIYTKVSKGDVCALEIPSRQLADGSWRQAHAYSVGLTLKTGIPELLVIGLPAGRNRELIINACTLLTRSPSRFPGVGQYIHDLTVGRPLFIRALALGDAARILEGANGHTGPQGLEACQLVFPDKLGWFPGQEGCDPKYAGIQDPWHLSRSVGMR